MGRSRKGKRLQSAAADGDEQPPSADAPANGEEEEEEVVSPRSAEARYGDLDPPPPPLATANSGGSAMAEASRDSSSERDAVEAERLKHLNAMLARRATEERERVAALQARLDELSADAGALAAGERGVLGAALAAPLRAAEEERAALLERLAAAQDLLGRAEAAAAREARARAEAAARLEAAVVENGLVLEHLSAKGTEAADATKKVAELETVVGELEAKISELLAEKGKLEKHLEAIKVLALSVQSQKAEVEERFNEFKRNTEKSKLEMEDRLDEKMRELETLRSSKAEVEENICSLEAELLVAAPRNKELKSELDAKMMELATTRNEMEKLRAEVAEVGKKHRMVVAQANGLRDEIDKMVKAEETAVAAYDAEKKDMKVELEKLKRNVDTIQTLKDAAEEMVHVKIAEARQLKDELNVLGDSMAELRALYDDLMVKSSCLQNDKDSVLEALHQEKAEADKLRSTTGELETCNGQKDREIGALMEDVEDKRGQIDGLNGELDHLQLALTEAQRTGKNAVWTWLCPATTTVLAAASFAYVARSR